MEVHKWKERWIGALVSISIVMLGTWLYTSLPSSSVDTSPQNTKPHQAAAPTTTNSLPAPPNALPYQTQQADQFTDVKYWPTYVLLLSVIVATIAIHRNNVNSRKKATVDIVVHDSSREDLQDAKRIVHNLKSGSLAHLGEEFENNQENRKAILLLLNHYEFLAVGTHTGAFDRKLLQELKHSSIVSTYDNLAICIHMMRKQKNSDTLFQDFEKLVASFKAKPLQKKT